MLPFNSEYFIWRLDVPNLTSPMLQYCNDGHFNVFIILDCHRTLSSTIIFYFNLISLNRTLPTYKQLYNYYHNICLTVFYL